MRWRAVLVLLLAGCLAPPPPRTASGLALRPTDRIAIDRDELRPIAERLAASLGLAGVDVTTEPRAIVLRAPRWTPRDVRVEIPASAADDGYTVVVDARAATVEATAYGGFFYGAERLGRLAKDRRVPAVRIEEAPRFRYRAMHLDVARHFFGRADVEHYLDLLAFHRFNVFHWHLTDDQGFRLPSPSHGEIARGEGNGPSYSEADVRAIVDYAAARAITVIPEIEMPGHSRAILAAHPELSCTGKPLPVPHEGGVFEDVLCAGNPGSYALVDDLLADVARLFPSRWIHIGGDEVPPARWSACPKCRAAAAKAGVDIPALEGLFLQHAARKLAELGRRPMVWDEALGATEASTPSPDTIIVAWQSKERGVEAARRGHDVVMAPADRVYFNTHQSTTGAEPGQDGLLPWTTVRAFDPLPNDPRLAPRILGAEGALWTEHVERRVQIDVLVVPRIAALADVLWSPPDAATSFVARFAESRPALDALGVAYFVDAPIGLAPRHVFLAGARTTLALAPPPLYPDAIVRWTHDGSEPSGASPAFGAPITIDRTTAIATAAFLPNGHRSPTIRGELVAETPRPPQADGPVLPGALFTYFEGNFKRLPDTAILTPLRRGVAEHIDLATVTTRTESFALDFDALVRVPATGVYRFVATADDGVRVLVDGAQVLEDDGVHAPREATGEIALAAGLHALHVAYFQGAEGKTLGLAWGPTDGTLGPLAPLRRRPNE